MAEDKETAKSEPTKSNTSRNAAYAAQGAGFILDMWQAGKARKYNQEQERYRNDMRRIQDAFTQNRITVAEIYASIDTRRKNIANEVEYMGAAGTLAVTAALSGFNGRTSRAISNAALRAKQLKTANIDESYERDRRNTDTQRLNSAFGMQLSLEDGWVQPPNYLAAAVNEIASGMKAAAGAG